MRRVAVVGAVVLALLTPHVAVGTDNVGRKWLPGYYELNGYQWYIRAKFASSVTSSQMRLYIKNGRAEWNNVGRELFFAWDPSLTNPPILVHYDDLWIPLDGKLAVAIIHSQCAGYICGADLTFNKTITGGAKHWYGQSGFSCENKYYDIWATSAHEFGHFVELGHTSQQSDTMWPTLPCGSTEKRSLTTHDKAGIQNLYPAH